MTPDEKTREPIGEGTKGPLAGLVVLDLGHFYMAPYATLLMALSGADVIKIEPPGGEHLRYRGDNRRVIFPFLMLNSNKRGVTLNLKSELGRQTLRRMIEKADVLIDNFAPGVMSRLGLAPEDVLSLNPRIVCASGSGFGRTGRYAHYPAADITIQAMSGVMSITGFTDGPPVKTGPAIADFSGGAHLYGAIVTALFERERTGRGQEVEVALYDSVYPSMASALGLYHGSEGSATQRTGNRHNGLAVAPYNVYQTLDGWISIMCFSNTHWHSLVALMDRADLHEDLAFQTVESRAVAIDRVDEIVSAWTTTTETTVLDNQLRAAGVPCAPVRGLEEVAADPHLVERGMIEWMDHREFGPVPMPGSPMRLGSHAPAPLRESPLLGEDNGEVYCEWLGLTVDEYQRLLDEKVIV